MCDRLRLHVISSARPKRAARNKTKQQPRKTTSSDENARGLPPSKSSPVTQETPENQLPAARVHNRPGPPGSRARAGQRNDHQAERRRTPSKQRKQSRQGGPKATGPEPTQKTGPAHPHKSRHPGTRCSRQRTQSSLNPESRWRSLAILAPNTSLVPPVVVLTAHRAVPVTGERITLVPLLLPLAFRTT